MDGNIWKIESSSSDEDLTVTGPSSDEDLRVRDRSPGEDLRATGSCPGEDGVSGLHGEGSRALEWRRSNVLINSSDSCADVEARSKLIESLSIVRRML